MNKKPEANRQQLAWQPELRPALPSVYGPLDYRIVRDQLIEIDRLLLCGIEADFVREVLRDLPAQADAKECLRRAKEAALQYRAKSHRRRLPGVCGAHVRNPSRAKGREHIGQAVGWAVLAHNLWVLARRELALRQSEQQAA